MKIYKPKQKNIIKLMKYIKKVKKKYLLQSNQKVMDFKIQGER